MKRSVLLLVIGLTGCSSEPPPPPTDAASVRAAQEEQRKIAISEGQRKKQP